VTKGNSLVILKLPNAMLAAALTLCASLSACGQRGDLYLPGPDAEPVAVDTEADNDDEGADDEGEPTSE
jgi:predicted small lipoprotein YifL